jgi:hypothetical protein
MQWGAVGAGIIALISTLSTGTLVVTFDPSEVAPVAVFLAGPVSGQWPLQDPTRIALTGLPPGNYQVRPVFAGTVEGQPQSTIVTRLATSELHVAFGDHGGFRFDADPGLCEPDYPWKVRMTHVVRDGRPAIRVGVVDGSPTLPVSSYCLRDIGGLAPGTYQIQVQPSALRLPPYTVSVRVAAGQWTTMRLVNPPVVVTGRVTSNGRPLAGVEPRFARQVPTGTVIRLPGQPISVGTTHPLFLSTSTGYEPSSWVRTETDIDGRYVAVLREPGEYQPAAGMQSQSGLADSPVTFFLGRNTHDFDVGGRLLRVTVISPTLPVPNSVPVTLQLKTSLEQPITRSISAAAPEEVELLKSGTYLVSAHTEFADSAGRMITLTSSRPHEVKVAANATADLVIELVERNGWLEVVNRAGQPVEGAYVLPFVRSTGLRTDQDGRVSLATIPVGARVPIRSRTWAVTCHVITDARQQRVVVDEALADLVVVVPEGEPGSPAGSTLTGISGATCPFPWEAFNIAQKRDPEGQAFEVRVPPGTYTLTLRDGRTFTARAPGRIEIR